MVDYSNEFIVAINEFIENGIRLGQGGGNADNIETTTIG
jgi:hypothetical protein